MSVSLRSADAIRSSIERWTELNTLLRRFEALAQAAALLDVDKPGADRFAEAAAFDAALLDLRRECGREATRLTVESLQATMRKHTRDVPALPLPRGNGHTGRTYTRDELTALLDRHNGNQTRAAMELGIKGSSLHYLLRRAGLR